MSDTPLKGHKDFTGNGILSVALAKKIALKDRIELLINEQKQNDKEIKEILGDHSSFICGQYTGTFKYEPKSGYTVQPQNPRTLRVTKN